MNAYISALIGLVGVAIGSLTSFATTWLTQRSDAAERRREREAGKREKLFTDFIVESTRLFGDALSHQKDDVPELVLFYAMVAQMRLVSSREVVHAAEHVMRAIVEAYAAGNLSFSQIRVLAAQGKLDFLREFSEVCRNDLSMGVGGR